MIRNSLENLISEETKKSPTYQLYKQHKQHRNMIDGLYQEYKYQAELKQIEENIYNRLVKGINIEIVDKATPAIKEIDKQIRDIFKK